MTATLSAQVTQKLRDRLGADFLEGYQGTENRIFIKINKERIVDAANVLVKDFDARLAAISAVDAGLDGFEVIYNFALDNQEKHLHVIVKALVDRNKPEISSLTSLLWSASWAERETAELLGVKFLGHPDLRHLFLPYEWPDPLETVDRTGIFDVKPETKGEGVAKWVPLPLDEKSVTASIIPIGPYHPALIESTFFKLLVKDELILNADVKVGFNHRGIMRLMERRNYWWNMFVAERVCGICSHHHSLAYTRTVESLAKVEVPDRARYIRTLVGELARLHSHLLWTGVAMDLIGFQTLFMLAWKIREPVMDCLEMLSGNRVINSINTLGGVRRDVSNDLIAKVEAKIKTLKKEVSTLVSSIVNDPIIIARTKGVGVLTRNDAKFTGVVGPTARASGLKIDVRKDDPYAAYDEMPFEVVTRSEGDVLARVEVRLGEVAEAINICEHCLDALKRIGGPLSTEVTAFEESEAMGKVEAPRGELVYFIESNGTNIPKSVRIRTPSFLNNSSLPFMLRNQTIGDAPIVIGSIDPCYSCTDRVAEIKDVRTGKSCSLTLSQLARRYRRK
jgi:formate hydrogenlyase subunit 5